MKKSMTHKAAALRIGALAIGALVLAPLPAMAIGSGAMVLGGGTCAVYTEGGPIATAVSVEQVSQQISMMQSSISSTLNRMGAALNSAQNSTASVIESEFKNQNNVLRQYMINARAGQIKAQAAIDEAPAQQGQQSCDSPGLAAGIQVGAQTNRDLTSRLTQSALAHDTGFSRSTDATAAVLAAPSAAFGPPAIFPQSGSMTQAQFGVARQWLSVTNSTMPLGTALKMTPAILSRSQFFADSIVSAIISSLGRISRRQVALKRLAVVLASRPTMYPSDSPLTPSATMTSLPAADTLKASETF